MMNVQRLSRKRVGIITRNGEIMNSITKDELEHLLVSGYTNEQLAAHFSCGTTTIKRRKLEFNLVGVKDNSKPITKNQIICIEALIEQGYCTEQIIKQTGISVHRLRRYLPDITYSRIITNSAEQFRQNKLKANMSKLFIPSSESAYICGVLQSDGYLTSDGYIGLTAKDKDFVNYFAEFFGTKVRDFERDGSSYYVAAFKDIRNIEKFKQITNIYPNKTYSSYVIPDWIKSNTEFYKSFLVGVFNGDGYVYRPPMHNTCDIGIEQHSLSRPFLKEINKVLDWNEYSYPDSFKICTKKIDSVKNFYDWYSVSEFALIRKVSVLDTVFYKI